MQGHEPAEGRDRIRASRAEREQVIDTLKTAFVRYRLTADELDTRVGKALTARTYADLDMLTADIPAVPDVRQNPERGDLEPYQPESRRVHAAITSGAAVIAVLTVTASVVAGVDPGTFAAVAAVFASLILTAIVAGLVTLVVARAVGLGGQVNAGGAP